MQAHRKGGTEEQLANYKERKMVNRNPKKRVRAVRREREGDEGGHRSKCRIL